MTAHDIASLVGAVGGALAVGIMAGAAAVLVAKAVCSLWGRAP